MKFFFAIIFFGTITFLVWSLHKPKVEESEVLSSKKMIPSRVLMPNKDLLHQSIVGKKGGARLPASQTQEPIGAQDSPLLSDGKKPAGNPSLNIPNQNRRHLTAGLDVVVYSMDEFRSLNPSHPLSQEEGANQVASVESVASQYPDEPSVRFTNLTGSCPSLDALNYAIALRIGTDGYVKEAAPLDLQGVSIPPEVYSCQFSGGPSSNFVTTYYPLQWRNGN